MNIGESLWPDPVGAARRVRQMQCKLHQWAVGDPGRRSDDVFNLVYHPDFLTVAWERVAGNKGARTAGVDRVSPASIAEGAEVVEFLEQVRTSGAEGGPGKRAGSNPDTAPRSDPYILGSNCRSAIATLVERQTRYTMLVHLPDDHSATAVRDGLLATIKTCLLYTSPSPRDRQKSRMPSSA